ncbi:CLUMA_CG013967, isoform A [Clunio marinus]|uniref:CLUMA_CG013967, isoform A n=1 Tax=Clunio marinus TaxID=568069 RepID=A0A1J1INN7_9DIPT|nr:CLUMA_CG013967, isoform A [Clunio marinus]
MKPETFDRKVELAVKAERKGPKCSRYPAVFLNSPEKKIRRGASETNLEFLLTALFRSIAR